MVQASTAKRTTPAKKPSSKTANELNVQKVAETAKESALVGLGVFGKVFDGVQDRVEGVREEAPKKWDDLVKRGAQLKDAANDKIDDVSFSYKFDMKEQRAQFRDVVKALRAFVTPSKA